MTVPDILVLSLLMASLIAIERIYARRDADEILGFAAAAFLVTFGISVLLSGALS